MLPSSPRLNLLHPELTDELLNPKLNLPFPEVSQSQFNRFNAGCEWLGRAMISIL